MGTRAVRCTPSGCGRDPSAVAAGAPLCGVGVRLGSGVALGRGVSGGGGVDVGVEVGERVIVGTTVDASTSSGPGSASALSVNVEVAATATPTRTITARISIALRSVVTAPLLEAPVDDTGEGYPGDGGVSRRAWRIAVAVLGVIIGVTGLAAIAIAIRPAVRRAAPIWADEFDRASREGTIHPGEGEGSGGGRALPPAPTRARGGPPGGPPPSLSIFGWGNGGRPRPRAPPKNSSTGRA